MKTITVKNTYQLPIEGAPAASIRDGGSTETVAVLPAEIPFIKPKLLVKEGDTVKIGTPMFFDKRDPELVFLSPGNGKVTEIQYGDRRRINAVIISLNKKESSEKLPQVKEPAKANADKIIDALQHGGVWGYFRELPFNRIPNTQKRPKSIYVTMDQDEAHTPDGAVVLGEALESFKDGIKMLKKLTTNVQVGISEKNKAMAKDLSGIVTHEIRGDYPANSPSVFVYHAKTSSDENTAWTVRAQDLLLMVETIKAGKYATERVITVAGSDAKTPSHVRTRIGASIVSVSSKKITKKTRVIAGGVLTGRKSSADSYIGYDDVAINLIPEGSNPEMFYFFKPGFNKPTNSKTYLSAIIPNMLFKMNTFLNGGERSCIACSLCVDVCPVGILPQFVHKSLRAGDIEDAVEHGLLDCADCGLCTYVCPSKIEIADDIKVAKAKLEKEVA